MIVGALAAVLAAFYALIYLLSHRPRAELPSEALYTTAKSETPEELPRLAEDATLEISVVIPCYNERTRLPSMLKESVPWLEKHFGSRWEILLCDDGSKDETVAAAYDWVRTNAPHIAEHIRATRLVENRGKGGAVTHGVLHARGALVLFADADGATQFSDLAALIKSIDGHSRALAVGSRAHMVNTDAVVKRTFVRNLLMYGLHSLLYLFGIRTIGDTQCGFKLFTREAAREIFPYMHTERWIFDVEVLIIAMRKGVRISEVPVTWHEVEGSKVDLARDSVLMAIDLVVIRFAYLLGIYRDSLHNESRRAD